MISAHPIVSRSLPVASRSREQMLDELVANAFPVLAIGQALVIATRLPNPAFDEIKRTADEQRRAWAALADHELRELYASRMAAARQESLRQKALQAQRREAAQFYNQPGAHPNFAFWLKADFWTFDDAMALLLGKDPGVVTWEAVSRAIAPPVLSLFASKPAPTPFLRGYLNLRQLALRSDVMTSTARLRPADVVSWARHRLGLSLPEPLRALLVDAAPKPASVTNAADAEIDTAARQDAPAERVPAAPVLVKRAALKALSDRWPTVENDLRHADRNGLSDAAKAERHGIWREQDALEWARQNGRLRPARAGMSLQGWPRQTHRISD